MGDVKLSDFLKWETCEQLGPGDFLLIARRDDPFGTLLTMAGRLNGKEVASTLSKPADRHLLSHRETKP